MYYLYILYSATARRHYIGISDNVERRLARHNKGDVRSTKAYRPWEVFRKEEYATKTEARKREIFLKRSATTRNELYTKHGPIV